MKRPRRPRPVRRLRSSARDLARCAKQRCCACNHSDKTRDRGHVSSPGILHLTGNSPFSERPSLWKTGTQAASNAQRRTNQCSKPQKCAMGVRRRQCPRGSPREHNTGRPEQTSDGRSLERVRRRLQRGSQWSVEVPDALAREWGPQPALAAAFFSLAGGNRNPAKPVMNFTHSLCAKARIL